MSRYLIKAINPKHRVTVGYDRAAGTTGAGYFAQIEDTEIENELEELINLKDEQKPERWQEEIDELESKVVVLWIGDDYRNPVNSPEELQKLIAPYATLDKAVKAQLQEDAQVESEQSPGIMKNFIQNFLDNPKS
ncbi:MAG: hypothetical protein AAF378_00050 [Cyanobacteria bacterium P01_A01_bin.84]